MHHEDLDLQPIALLLGTRASALLRGSGPQEGRPAGRLILRKLAARRDIALT
jgi:hypothetical protein